MIRHSTLVGSLFGIAVAVPYFLQTDINSQSPSAKTVPQQKTVVLSTEPVKKPAAAPSFIGGKVVIPIDARGHFQADFKFNGRKVHAIIDTGATYIALNRSTAARLGVRVTAQDMIHSVSTANGTTKAAAVIIDDVAIGKIRVSNVEAIVLNDNALDQVLLGMSFLKQIDRFSIENGTLILQQ
jgi:aspartyl protease family protein